MSTRSELLDHLQSQGIQVEHHADNVRGIPASLLRHREGDAYVVTVGGDRDAKDQVGALVDGLGWVASQTDGLADLVLRVASARDPGLTSGVVSALASMCTRYGGDVAIHLETESTAGQFAPALGQHPPVEGDPRLVTWKKYLETWYATRPTGLARDILEQDRSDSLRLYPQLSKNPKNAEWSLRLDGLQVGKVNPATGWLRVGTAPTAQKAVRAWAAVRPGGYGKETLGPGDAVPAAKLLHKLADHLQSKGGLVDHGQPEHSLESAILRGKVEVHADTEKLQLPWQQEGRTQRIAWGSQIPTLWWSGGTPRYLDALMKHGRTPWAVEMKVAAAGGGYGRYLRQGLTQAVLYRHFLRSAYQYDAWLDSLGMDRRRCRAALLYPQPTASVAPIVAARLGALDLLCRDFDVTPIRVDVPGLH